MRQSFSAATGYGLIFMYNYFFLLLCESVKIFLSLLLLLKTHARASMIFPDIVSTCSHYFAYFINELFNFFDICLASAAAAAWTLIRWWAIRGFLSWFPILLPLLPTSFVRLVTILDDLWRVGVGDGVYPWSMDPEKWFRCVSSGLFFAATKSSKNNSSMFV